MVPGLLATYASKNNAANLHLSSAIQDTGEEGFAAAGDDEAFAEDRAAGLATLDGATYYPFTFREISADVVAQTSYPAFVAVLARTVSSPGTPASDRSTCSDHGSLLVFEKDSASAPWRVAFEPTANLSAVPAFVTGAGGFGEFSGSQDYRVPLDNVATTYASDLQLYATTGTLQSGLSASMFSGSCSIFPNFRASVSSVARLGLTAAFTFTPTTAVRQVSWVVKGGALVVLGITGTETITAPIGRTFVERHTAGSPGTFEVASGTYSSVTLPIDEELAVFDPYATSPTGAVPVASTIGFLAGTGTHAA